MIVPKVVFATVALALAGLALAQDIGTVIFRPTAQQVYEASIGNDPGRIAPDPSSDSISFTVQAWGNVRVVVASNIPVPFELIADYNATTHGAVPEVVLSTSQQTVFDANWGWRFRTARVDVNYFLHLTGAVAPGTYTVTVTYTLIGANSVTNTIRVIVPPVVGVRLSGGDTVAFDYANAPLAYYSAIGGTLPPTAQGTTLASVDVLSASPYTMTASLAWSGPGSAGAAGTVRLKGVTLGAGATVVATGPGTGGSYATVIVTGDFALAITGSETPGSYSGVVTYSVASP